MTSLSAVPALTDLLRGVRPVQGPVVGATVSRFRYGRSKSSYRTTNPQ